MKLKEQEELDLVKSKLIENLAFKFKQTYGSISRSVPVNSMSVIMWE